MEFLYFSGPVCCLPKLSVASLDFRVSYQALSMPWAAGNAGRRNRTQSQINIGVQAGWGGEQQESASWSPQKPGICPPDFLPTTSFFSHYKGETGGSQNCLQCGQMKLTYTETEGKMGKWTKTEIRKGEQNGKQKDRSARESQRPEPD